MMKSWAGSPLGPESGTIDILITDEAQYFGPTFPTMMYTLVDPTVRVVAFERAPCDGSCTDISRNGMEYARAGSDADPGDPRAII